MYVYIHVFRIKGVAIVAFKWMNNIGPDLTNSEFSEHDLPYI